MSGRQIDIFIDENPNCPDGCTQRFSASGVSRPVQGVEYPLPGDRTVRCTVVGWSSAGGGTACAAHAVAVEDSGAGVATLVYGGDWGIRLTPEDGSEPFGEPYLLLADDSMLTYRKK